MLIGIPKEIKNHEYRISLTPSGVRELVEKGHKVLVETQGGDAVGLSDRSYREAGAEIAPTPADIFASADLILKVKEPQPSECTMLRPGQLLFTYLHLAADAAQTQLLVNSKATAIAYETITDNKGRLPLLIPMSEVAGRMSVQAGAHCLEKAQGGNGMLLGGVPGVRPANVLILGGGVVGLNAARMATGLGASVTILDRNLDRLKEIDDMFGSKFYTLYSTIDTIETQLRKADLVIGAVLIPGAAAPKLITREMLGLMKKGSVLVDVAIDQGGCFATSKATTHADPTYVIDDIIHYCVANMPGAVARTSTFALVNATLPYVMRLADQGINALLTDAYFLQGLNVHQGLVTNMPVAKALGYDYTAPDAALNMTV